MIWESSRWSDHSPRRVRERSDATTVVKMAILQGTATSGDWCASTVKKWDMFLEIAQGTDVVHPPTDIVIVIGTAIGIQIDGITLGIPIVQIPAVTGTDVRTATVTLGEVILALHHDAEKTSVAHHLDTPALLPAAALPHLGGTVPPPVAEARQVMTLLGTGNAHPLVVLTLPPEGKERGVPLEVEIEITAARRIERDIECACACPGDSILSLRWNNSLDSALLALNAFYIRSLWTRP